MDDDVSNRDRVGRALELVIEGLQPFVAEMLQPHVREGVAWPEILEQIDRAKGIRDKVYRSHDLQILLRALTERLGSLGFPFNDRISRVDVARASELREARNRWAHHDDFNDSDTYRMVDTAERLMRSIGAESVAEHLASLAAELRVVPAQRPADETQPTPADVAPDADQRAEDEVPIRDSGVTIEIDAHAVFSYAAAHNRIQMVSGLRIHNSGDDRPGVVVRLAAGTAGSDLSLPSETLLDLAAGRDTVITDPELRLDPAALLEVEERRPGWITATVESDGVVLARARAEVTVLAARQWVAEPEGLGLELLASFVQPNHPLISVLLREASDVLLERTGNGSLDGYQSESPERVDEIVESIYAAMQAREIRYAEPPASWSDKDAASGQKVRNPADVLEGRLGTCLDTVVTMSAALEQAGINTVLWLADRHIFLGYWRAFGASPMVANAESIEFINLVDNDVLGVVETTMITTGKHQATFADARNSPRETYFVGRGDELLGVTDVFAARKAGILPLPARTVAEDGTVVVTEYVPESSDGRDLGDVERRELVDGRVIEVPRRVSTWKNALLDLTLRNRLINFTPSSRLRLAIPTDDVAHVEDLVNVGKPITLIASDELPEIAKQRGIRSGRELAAEDRTKLLRERSSAFVEVTEATYATRFRSLAYRAKTIEQETGANNLYLAFGTLLWHTNDRDIESPLILVPVRLELGRGGRYRIVLDEAGGSTPNYCLLEKLRIVQGLSIPGLAEPADDGAGIDIAAAFRAARDAITKAGLPYRVEETVDLSILQFAKFRLWKDLDENWADFGTNELVDHLIHRPHEPFQSHTHGAGDDLDALLVECPAPADASQLAAVAAAVAGETFVLEGPPGTGKSQTITNLLARATAEGKRVLFVAEKRAALEVVRRRLEEVGLGPLSLDLHDKGSRPAAVRQQIKHALEHRVSTDREGLTAAIDSVDGNRRSLARYAERIHETNDVGLSYYSARTRRLSLDADLPHVEVPRTLVNGPGAEDHALVRAALRQLPDSADRARPRRAHPWAFVAEPIDDLETTLADMTKLDADVSALNLAPATAAVLGEVREGEDLRWLARVASAPRLDLAVIDAAQEKRWRLAATSALGAVAKVQADYSQIEGLSPRFAVEDWSAVLVEVAVADKRNIFVRKRARRAVLAQMAPHFADASTLDLRRLAGTAQRLVELQAAARSARDAVDAVEHVNLPGDGNPVTADLSPLTLKIDRATTLAKEIGSSVVADNALRAAGRALYAAQAESADLSREFEETADLWDNVLASFVPSTGSAAAQRSGSLRAWIDDISSRDLSSTGASVGRSWNAFLMALRPLATAGLGAFRAALISGDIPAERALEAFDAGVAEASLAERADATALDGFSASTHMRAIERFTSGIETIRSHQTTAIPARMLAERTFDAHSSSGQVGELRRQLERQRGGLGVRDLMDRYGDLILDLTPCVLMSPESVARFLVPDRALFDIVVFDEASQIRVADAVGAMGRAKSVVVVGDSKQMPPTSFADVSVQLASDEERTSENVVDEESILTECVAARVPSRALTWHYRSQDEVLIQFSNERYYGNLSSFPSPLHATRHDENADHGISLIRLPGQFLRDAKGKDLRTNPVEAQAIVNEVMRRFDASPDVYPSLGIVTFNAQQRALVEALLRDSGEPRIGEALDSTEDGLFVKNLENVQGDERDTILFSTAFSANAKGVLPLNFGPVGMAGGERRLNVAITRARRQVIVYSSFDPSDMRTENTSSIGLKHLRAYLELAASSGRDAERRPTREYATDRHRDDIAAALRARGVHVATDVGLSDFRVDLSLARAAEPDRPLVAVLLDNRAWAERATVSDRDGLPVEVLANLMRWPAVERVWMPEWLADRDAVVDRLVASLERAGENALLQEFEPQLSAPTQPAADPATESSSVVPIIERPVVGGVFRSAPAEAPAVSFVRDDVEPFRAWPSRRAGSTYELDQLARDGQIAVDIQRLINEIVEFEGPVHRLRVAKLVAGAYGLERVAAARVNAILRCISRPLGERSDAAFLWPETIDRSTWTAYRRSTDGTERPLEYIAPREIANAMAWLVNRHAGMYEDELRREALHEFGMIRMTTNITSLLDAGLAFGLQNGLLLRNDSGLIVHA